MTEASVLFYRRLCKHNFGYCVCSLSLLRLHAQKDPWNIRRFTDFSRLGEYVRSENFGCLEPFFNHLAFGGGECIDDRSVSESQDASERQFRISEVQ